VFVIFRRPSQKSRFTVAPSVRERLGVIRGPWHVNFQTGRGAPEQTTFTELKSWTTSSDPGIKFFSGTASYKTTLNVSEQWIRENRRFEIDLGAVKNVAEILVNGRSAGIAWKSPYRLDVTDLLKPATNLVTIRITNLWPNRLIGDKQPNAPPIASTTFNPYRVDSPLLESGLMGPVTFLGVKEQRAAL
jgi:Glycosyl hydrolases family 2, sugar binding domain